MVAFVCSAHQVFYHHILLHLQPDRGWMATCSLPLLMGIQPTKHFTWCYGACVSSGAEEDAVSSSTLVVPVFSPLVGQTGCKTLAKEAERSASPQNPWYNSSPASLHGWANTDSIGTGRHRSRKMLQRNTKLHDILIRKIRVERTTFLE